MERRGWMMKYNLKKLKNINNPIAIWAWVEGFEAEVRKMKCPANVHCVGMEKLRKEVLG